MKKFFKWFAISVGGLFVCFIGLVILVGVNAPPPKPTAGSSKTLAIAEPEQPPSNQEQTPSDQDYGIDSIVVSKNEQIADQKYGGFPNNKHFNNDTKCIAVKNYFADSKKSSLDADFIRYAVPSLALMDIVYSTANNAPFLRNHIDPMLWKLLIINYDKYCLENPSKTLFDATLDIYKMARSSFWRD